MSFKNWNIVETASFSTIIEACNIVKATKEMVGILGNQGAGKTTALKAFCYDNEDAVYIRARKSMRPKRFFEKLLKQMGVRYTGTIYDMIERIEEHIQSNAKPSVIVIDEAGKLDQTMLMYLQDLRDMTEETTGIVLASVGYFRANLKKAVEKQRQGMPEFDSRVSRWIVVNQPLRPEVEAICSENGLGDKKAISKIRGFKDFRKVKNQVINELLIMQAGQLLIKEANQAISRKK